MSHLSIFSVVSQFSDSLVPGQISSWWGARSFPAETEGGSGPVHQFYCNHETTHRFWAQKAKLEHSLCLILTRSHSTSSTSYDKLQASDGRMKVSRTKKVHSYHCAPGLFSICPILTPSLLFLPKSSFYPKVSHGSGSVFQRKWLLL